MPDQELSLAAETLLLAIDPGAGGLIPRYRRRFRRALATAHRAEGGRITRPHAWVDARARRELARAGLIESGQPFARLRLVDKAATGSRYRRLAHGLVADCLSGQRDRELAALLGWSGILRARMSRDEWRRAVRRLRSNASAPAVESAPLSGRAPMTQGILALGAAVSFVTADRLSDSGISDFGGGGDGGFGGDGAGGGGSGGP